MSTFQGSSQDQCREACVVNPLCGGWTTNSGNYCWTKQIGHTRSGPGTGWTYQLNDRM